MVSRLLWLAAITAMFFAISAAEPVLSVYVRMGAGPAWKYAVALPLRESLMPLFYFALGVCFIAYDHMRNKRRAYRS